MMGSIESLVLILSKVAIYKLEWDLLMRMIIKLRVKGNLPLTEKITTNGIYHNWGLFSQDVLIECFFFYVLEQCFRLYRQDMITYLAVTRTDRMTKCVCRICNFWPERK